MRPSIDWQASFPALHPGDSRGSSTQQRVSREKRQTAKAFRKHSTPAEAAAWALLRTRPFGLKWRRQHALHGFIVDFYCPAIRLALEVQSGVPGESDVRSAEEERTTILQGFGIRVLHVTEDGVEASCLRSISSLLAGPDHDAGPTPTALDPKPAGNLGKTGLPLHPTVPAPISPSVLHTPGWPRGR